MPGEMRPPPLPSELGTEPGLGLLALKRDNERLRRALADALSAAAEVPDTIPPPTMRQRRVRTGLTLGKYAVLLPVVALAARAAARQWPELTELVDAVLGALGL